MADGLTTAEAADADAGDPLSPFLHRFERPDPDLSYLDGNSLGRPPIEARAVATALIDTWSTELVSAWEHWIDRPLEVGDLVATLLGAAPGQVVVGESTTVALYQAVEAALRARPDRSIIVACADDFPTDRYVVDGIARARGAEVRWLDSVDDATARVDANVAVMLASAAHFETAALADVGAITLHVHDAGALVVWDCSHAGGAVPLDLDRHEVDLAVGCTYKYLHGGPGAPAWAYVARRHQQTLRQPIQGWFGQRDQFAMGPVFEPADGMTAWRCGTPGMLGLEIAATGIAVVAEAGIDAVRVKSLAMGHVMLAAADQWFAPLGLELISPRDDARRGGHVALRHPDGSRIVRAARQAGVVADFRAPDIVRLGPGPLATSFTELLSGLERLRDVVASGAHELLDQDPGRVT